MSGAARHTLSVLLLLAVIGIGMFLLNSHTPLMMDDYDYSFSWSTGEKLAGVGDILASQAAHYRLWGGRSVVHFLAQAFLYWGKPVFNVANTLMYLLLLLEICLLSRRRGQGIDVHALLGAHALLLCTVPFFGVVFLWLDGACNYLWGTALALVPLLIAKSEREGGFFDAGVSRGWLALPLSFLAGWTNENTACGVLTVCLLLIAWDALTGRKVRAWRIAALFVQALGVAVLLLAPGNFARPSEATERGLMMELIYRAAVVSYCLLRCAIVPAALILFALLIARKKKAVLRAQWLCVLAGAAFLSSYALTGSPQISDRSFTGVIVLLIAALLALLADLEAQERRAGARAAAGGALMAIIVACSVCALGSVKAHGAAWRAQEDKILAAVSAGEAAVEIASVPSDSRFTMDIALAQDAKQWPNSTLSKYYGIGISGM